MNIYPDDVYKPRMYALASDEAAATRTAGMLFRRGFAYVGRAADNPGQKGGFAVSTGGREFVAEAPLIAHADFARLNEGAEKAKLNFWGVRFRIAPVRRRRQHTRPAYVLDVRPNAQGRLNLALDTFWSNVTMLDGVRTKLFYLPGEKGFPFKGPGHLERLAAAYAAQDGLAPSPAALK